MFIKTLILFHCFLAVNSQRNYLPENRRPLWKMANNVNRGPDYGQPEQVHLAYGGDPSIMSVTWLTFDDTIDSIVEYGEDIDNLDKKVTGRCAVFVDGQKAGTWRYIHRVNLTGLEPGKRYFYHVGSVHGWSPIFFFRALKPRSDGGFEFAVYGDLGSENGRSIGKIQELVQKGQIDMILHVGDFAYDMYENDGETGDQFMRQIEPISAYVPYMTAVGNHENYNNFTHYVNRFTMPNSEHNLFYSFDLDQVHFVVFSTEFYFYTDFGWQQIENQYKWLINDLTKANENRHKVPWIITMAHRPMYCSDFDGDDCTKFESIIRTGLPLTHGYALEKLFFENNVDVEIWAHEHTYERFWPVYNRTIYNGTNSPYHNPPAPVHIVTGSAGCRENTDIFVEHPPPWSAVRVTDYGFGRMRVYNSTHLRFRQVPAAPELGDSQDDFWVIKTARHHKQHKHKNLRKLSQHGTYIPLDYCHHSCDNQNSVSDRDL